MVQVGLLHSNQLKLAANNAEYAVQNTEKLTHLCREFYSWVFAYAYTVESHYVTLTLSACLALYRRAENSDTCPSSSGAEYYKLSLIVMEVASSIRLSYPMPTHCENYAISHCN